jgi:monoamine oxidase
MARTPLLRSLRQLMHDIRAAKSSGLPVDVVREERRIATTARISRRQFLAGAAVGGAALALPGTARASRSQPVVAIVGGGISGLTCALTLRDRGITSTVYEASGRVGGRMFSNSSTWAAGQVSEWGGEFIDTGHVTVRRLARRYGLGLEDMLAAEPEGSTETYFIDGRYYSKADADADFLEIADIVQADLDGAGFPTSYNDFTPLGAELDNLSVYEWIESRVPGGHSSPLGQLLDVAYATEYGADSTQQSSLNLLYLLAFQPDASKLSVLGESDQRFHIRGGNQRLPEAITDDLGCDVVRTGNRLTRLRQSAGGRYQLTFERGSRHFDVTADHVVLALPFAVLDQVDIDGAGFDALKRTAIHDLGRGRNGKISAQFQTRGWRGRGPWPGIANGTTYGEAGYQSSWETSRAQPGTQGILTLFSAGSVTDAMRSTVPFATASDPRVRHDVERGLRQLDRVFPNLQWNGRATESLFHLSPQARLSYSYFKVGQYTTFAGYEGVRQGQVYFCGEHTSQEFQGYMEGGASTGKATAISLARAIR